MGGAAGAGSGPAGAGAAGGPALPLPLPPPPPDDLANRMVSSVCQALLNCSALLSEIYGAGCTSQVRPFLVHGDLGFLASLISRGKVLYDGSGVDACLAAVAGATCSELEELSKSFSNLGAVFPAECGGLMAGTVATGGACTAHIECVSPGYCDFFAGSCPGQCALPVTAGGCDDPVQCATGLACSPQGSCTPSLMEGEPCASGQQAPECMLGQWCVQGMAMGAPAGVCTADTQVWTEPEGSPCDPNAGRLCERGLVCAADVGGMRLSCVPKAAKGRACWPLSFPTDCPRAQYCAPGAMGPTGMGTCAPRLGAGLACDDASACRSDLFCGPPPGGFDPVCRMRLADGLACSDDEACLSRNCRSGRCTPQGMCLE